MQVNKSFWLAFNLRFVWPLVLTCDDLHWIWLSWNSYTRGHKLLLFDHPMQVNTSWSQVNCTCVKFTAIRDFHELASWLANLFGHPSQVQLCKFWFCKLASTCKSIWPGLQQMWSNSVYLVIVIWWWSATLGCCIYSKVVVLSFWSHLCQEFSEKFCVCYRGLELPSLQPRSDEKKTRRTGNKRKHEDEEEEGVSTDTEMLKQDVVKVWSDGESLLLLSAVIFR